MESVIVKMGKAREPFYFVKSLEEVREDDSIAYV